MKTENKKVFDGIKEDERKRCWNAPRQVSLCLFSFEFKKK